ncbi:MAG: GlsB/YeaQ/YmgE family stress response membrane protein [Blastocatellia bacterium]|jgi:uncharacterized membrane protein YeaQ/YmgE (transglycosylase-associated protein family)|nr:GlsB/YeaQ/YmgE family stress response membrane protein [Blastocatellia bacterium]
MEILLFLLIGAVAGWLASMIMGGGGYGLIGDIVIGVIGGFIGGYLFKWFNVSAGSGWVGSLVTALVGAIVLLAVIRTIKRA